MYRNSNGGFYPGKTAAEFSRTYVNSLRQYSSNSRPADYARPVSSLAARKLSKVGAEKEADPYLMSQTYSSHKNYSSAVNQKNR